HQYADDTQLYFSFSSSSDKPGRCPPSPAVIKPPCQKRCKGDNTCPGAKKCCNMMCSLVCVDPVFDLALLECDLTPLLGFRTGASGI
ncbi:omwaprin-a-like, partial [Rhineura floridana]|uniref:omwaprin-a-like n=1 Tax=Rhineura floridana TaxID=261503 RepID=UPI002AC7F9BD